MCLTSVVKQVRGTWEWVVGSVSYDLGRGGEGVVGAAQMDNLAKSTRVEIDGIFVGGSVIFDDRHRV